MIKKKKNFKEIEGAEYGVDSRYSGKKEKLSDSEALMEARLQRMRNLPSDKIMQAKLLQLKLKMEEYLEQPVYDDNDFFTGFLTSYIDIIYSKRSDFANDIDITPVRLSQVLHRHREPQDEFILRLMIHSEKTYENICQFPKKTWYQVFYHEKICDTISSQAVWRPEVEKHVNISKLIKV